MGVLLRREVFREGAAIVARLHHCIADGVALVRLLLGLAEGRPEGAPDRAVPQIPKAVGKPVRPSGYVRALGSAAATLGKLAFMSFDPPTRFKGRLGVEKLVTWSRPIPLEDIRRAGHRLASTVNDILLTAVAGALHRYLTRHQGVPPGMNVRAVGQRDFEQVVVSNADQVVPVFAAASPPPKWHLLDRYLVSAEASQLPALICITKTDLLSDRSEVDSVVDSYREIAISSFVSAS